MKKLIIAAALMCMGTNLMAQEQTQVVVAAEKTCQDWVNQFDTEVTQLKAEIAKLTIDAKADKNNNEIKGRLKDKKNDLKIAQQNLKAAKTGLKNETAADKEITKAKAQVAKLQQKKDKADAAVQKAEQKVVKAEQGVTKAEQKVASAEQGVAKAQQKVEAAKADVAKAKDVVTKAKDDVAKAKDNAATMAKNTDVNSAAIKTAEDKKAAAKANILKSITIRPDGTSGR